MKRISSRDLENRELQTTEHGVCPNQRGRGRFALDFVVVSSPASVYFYGMSERAFMWLMCEQGAGE